MIRLSGKSMDILKDMENIMFKIKTTDEISKIQPILESLRKDLNLFFTDSTCRQVLYTKNTDKLFFGMCVMPFFRDDDVMPLLTDENDKSKRISEYYVELDSKLFDPMLNLSAKEMVAILMHEVGHLVNDTSPCEDVKNAVNSYLAQTNTHLFLKASKQYAQLLVFAIKNSLIKFTSIFGVDKDEEVVADEFVVACGLGNELESALNKIYRNKGKLNTEVKDKLLILQWTLGLYKDVKHKRIPALYTLNKVKALCPSVLQKREMDNAIRALNSIDDDRLIVESSITDIALSLSKGIGDLYKRMKSKGMRSLEEDYFDLAIRVKNCDEQDDALAILRMINMRLSIIEDYIATDGRSLEPEEKQKWFDMMAKYRTLRDILTKKTTYTDKYYGLFVKTPVIKSRYDM